LRRKSDVVLARAELPIALRVNPHETQGQIRAASGPTKAVLNVFTENSGDVSVKYVTALVVNVRVTADGTTNKESVD
jgi:hypothetical protein